MEVGQGILVGQPCRNKSQNYLRDAGVITNLSDSLFLSITISAG